MVGQDKEALVTAPELSSHAQRVLSLLREHGPHHAASVAYRLQLAGEAAALEALRELKKSGLVGTYENRRTLMWSAIIGSL
jgi:predicted ArsR family transcriptional regulator